MTRFILFAPVAALIAGSPAGWAAEPPRTLTSASASPEFSGTPAACVHRALKALAGRGYLLTARGDWGAAGRPASLPVTIAIICQIPGRIVITGSYPGAIQAAGKAEVNGLAAALSE